MKTTDSLMVPSRQILDEASAWFVDFRVGDADLKTREAFNAWLCRSPEHIRAYLQIAETYSQLPALKGRPALNVEKLAARACSDGNVFPFAPVPSELLERAATLKSRGIPNLRRPFMAAAGIVMLAALSFLGYNSLHSSTYTTGTGEQRQITLDDGSTVLLNARSRLRARFSKHNREIDLLSGQALFDVAKDSARPFTVRSQGVLIRAVGTQFDVYQKKNRTTVTVVEGKVSVVSTKSAPRSEIVPLDKVSSSPAYLTAGEQAIVSAGSVLKLKKNATSAATAWTQRRLVFDGTPLTDVADEFNRYNERELTVRGSGAGSFHVSGVYSSMDPASLLRFLKAQPGITVQETETEIIVVATISTFRP
jgi:transmembrane sensor